MLFRKLKRLIHRYTHQSASLEALYKKLSRLRTLYNMQLSDEKFLKKRFYEDTGKKLDLENPQTFNEKLQWLKLHDRKPEYTTMVDKYGVREYVKSKIGEEYLIPLLGVWDKAEDIDFNMLPEQFVLKCNHDCGSVIICKNKATFDRQKAIKKLASCLKKNYFWTKREWPYKNVVPKVIAEEYIADDKTSELRDYKFFCFNGEVRLMFVGSERQSGEEVKFDFYDRDFVHQNIIQGHPNSDKILDKPSCYDEMLLLAEQLSKGHTHLRVDFYEANNKIFFGELTFYHFGGTMPFQPEEWDKVVGEWIKLPIGKNL